MDTLPPTAPKGLGRLKPEQIRLAQAPRPPEGLIERVKALGHAVSMLSDVMDELGVTGVVPSSTLRPTIDGTCICGPALTVRNVPLAPHAYELARKRFNGMAEIEAHNIATPGDVLVISGVAGVSNMGGVSASIAKRQGTAGAIIQGGARDVSLSREIGFPVWSSEVTPITGKWRIETVEVNGTVEIFGLRVEPGDLIVADEDGVCLIPIGRAEEVVALAEKKHKAEAVRLQALAEGTPIRDLPKPA